MAADGLFGGGGAGEDAFDERRRRMVESQLRSRGIRDDRVLRAMGEVPRHEFVPERLRDAAYDDSALGIGHGQTISQPYTVAIMTQAASIEEGEKVLEIGTGSGYGAAVLSRIARQVFTLERVPELARDAEERLKRLGYDNVEVRVANGTLGLAEEGPLDAIIVTAGAEALPLSYVEQLAEGGRLVIPIGSLPRSQEMFRFTKLAGELKIEELGGFAFVPLIGKFSWSEDAAERRGW